MEIQHQTIPNQPQEAPVSPPQPEIQQPTDPGQTSIPQEHPLNEPQEVPDDNRQEDELPQEGDHEFIERSE